MEMEEELLKEARRASEDIGEWFPPWDLGSGRMSSFYLQKKWSAWWRVSS